MLGWSFRVPEMNIGTSIISALRSNSVKMLQGTEAVNHGIASGPHWLNMTPSKAAAFSGVMTTFMSMFCIVIGHLKSLHGKGGPTNGTRGLAQETGLHACGTIIR